MNNKLKNFNYKQQGNFSPIFSTRSVSIVSFPLYCFFEQQCHLSVFYTTRSKKKMKSELSKDNYIYVLLERNFFFFSFSFF